LIEGDPVEQPNERPDLVARLRDEVGAVRNAITTVSQRITEAENRLTAERNQSRREVAGRELTAAADALDLVANDLAGVIAKVPAALGAVLDRLPCAVVSRSHTVAFANEVVAALRMVVSELRSHAAQIVSGGAQVCEPAQQPANPPPPPVARQQIFLLINGQWLETDGSIKTAGKHRVVDPPAAIAKLALEYGHAIDPTNELSIILHQRQPPCYAVYSQSDCLDISQPKPLTPPVGPTAASLPIHSEFVGRPRVGTARIARAYGH
jgi:hypothetical protein